MKATTITCFSAAAAMAIVSMLVPSARQRFTALPVVHAQAGCSNAMVSGNYGLTFSGFQLQGRTGKSVPFYGTGLLMADGAGNLAGTFSGSESGSLPGNRYVLITNAPYTATYAVNSDCTGLFTATAGSGNDSFTFVIVNGGNEIIATDVSAPDTLNLDLKKQ